MNRLISLFVLVFFFPLYVGAVRNAPSWEISVKDLMQKDSLKVLDIGNSYTDDATALLPLITSASGTDISSICIYKATRPSASFKTWYETYNNLDFKDYSIKKILGGMSANIATGSGDAFDGILFRDALTHEQWDMIIIHQVSGFAPYYEQWLGNNAGGYLNELLDLIKGQQPQAAIGFLLVHSYWDNYWANTEESSFNRWQLIANSTKQLLEERKIDFVIPYGTAVQNLRNSALNNEYDLTRDGTHLEYGLSRYAAACCYYQSVIYPRSGISVLGNTARYDASVLVAEYPSVTVDDSNAEIAQKAAILAVMNPYVCMNPENYDTFLQRDFDGDGKITIGDITILIKQYLKEPLR